MATNSPKPSLYHKLSSISTIRVEPTHAFSSILVLFSFLLFLNTFSPLKPFYFLDTFSIEIPNVKANANANANANAKECDYSNGKWVWDETYRNEWYTENCPLLDRGFQCVRNGREETGYRNWRWQPHGCDLPRFNASDMLERSRNKRIVFAGDSVGRNQWESLLCMLSMGVSNKQSIYEVSGNPITKHKGFLSIRFKEYNLTVEYYRTPFLVVIGRPPPNSSHLVAKAIRLDTPQWRSKRWVGADVLIMNTAHWWSKDKTIDQGYYFQVGKAINMTMDIEEAFQTAMETLKRWAIRNMKLENNFLFFRSYSPTHFRNGNWNSGGKCESGKQPQTNLTMLRTDPWYNWVISRSIESMKSDSRKVQLLNITYLTEFREDGHPSSHREPGIPTDAPQDCSHWCLPGVPDTWNELLYAYLLSKDYNAKSI